MSHCNRFVDVDLPYSTSKVEHLVAIAATVSNILLRLHRNGYLGTARKSFGDLETFSIEFCIFCKLNVRHISTFGLFYLLRQVRN